MERNSTSILPALVTAFLFLFTPACIDYQELTEVELLSLGQRFENREVEDFSFDEHLVLTIGPNRLSIWSPFVNRLLAALTGFSLQTWFSDQQLSCLRC